MAEHIYGFTFGQAWIKLVKSLLSRGKESSPRTQKTKEIINVTFEVNQCQANILVSKVRDLNYRFMIAEWLWITAGLNDLQILAQYNSQMKQFSDDGEILSGAYGPRLMPQIPYILQSLKKPDSRQAVATIWVPSPTDSKDMACTISLQWLIRGEKLHCTANMRSSDVWLGLPYDFFTFSQITNYLASILKISTGSLTMNLASSHIYEGHWDQAIQVSFDDVQTIWSPNIPIDEEIPTSTQIVGMLNHDLVSIGPFWSKYQEALSHSKSHALEVLRGIQS